MDLLILGGNGYLGSKLLRALNEEGGHRLVCTVRDGADRSRLTSLTERGKVRCIPPLPEAILAAMEETSFDAVCNMACSYGRKGMLYPNVLEANLEFPLRVLNAAADRGIGRFITIGTGLPEEMNMYSFSKHMFSSFGRYYAEHYGIGFCALRLEMFYSADEPRDRFIPKLIEQMTLGRDVDVSIGTQHRDIIAVEDVLRAILLVLHTDWSGYQEIPVGTGIAPTIGELVDFVWEETGRVSRVNRGAFPMRENEPDCVADTTRLRQLGGGRWEPVFWQDGIREMIRRIDGERME